jgi:HAMP domain-containing protein
MKLMKRFTGGKSIGKKLLRRLLLTVSACVVLLAIIVLILNIWQFSARRRIGRALQTIQRLEASNATDEQVQSALTDLNADVERTCADGACRYSIAVEHTLFRSDTRTGRFFEALMDGRFHDMAERIGFRPADLGAILTTVNGRTHATTVRLYVGYAPTFLAVYERVAHFHAENPMLDTHPDFQVRHPHLTTRGGGEVIRVELTPEAPPEAVDFARNYDLSCITRWGGCDRADELMLKAAANADALRDWDAYRFRGCPIKTLARDSDAVVLARIVRIEPYHGSWNGPYRNQQFITYKLLEVLKKRPSESLNIERVGQEVRKGSLTADPYNPGLSHELFAPGRTVLVFARHPGEFDDIDPDCGVLPADAELLTHVREVVAKEKAFD